MPEEKEEASPKPDECTEVREVLSRKSWVTAMPMDAKANDVRSQARNVRSMGDGLLLSTIPNEQVASMLTNLVLDDHAPRSLCFLARASHTCRRID